MTLAFLNPVRSFDEARNAVRFLGHDGMFEIQFFVEIAALDHGRRRGSSLSDADYLSSFDRNRTSIEEVARAVYSRYHSNLNVLTAANFEIK